MSEEYSDEYEEEMISIPEVSPQELAQWMKDRPGLVLLDVREPYEFPRAKMKAEGVVHAPLSDLARKHLDALPQAAQDKEATLVIFCHHGYRSAQVTAWLQELGWKEVYNLAGGIDAYARTIDPEIGFY